MTSRYLVGIDLGTTNSALTYVDMDVESNPSLSTVLFRIAQYGADGCVGERATLPSFSYLPLEGEVVPLPWQRQEHGRVVGEYAREAGRRIPQRQVRSAKSWLSNSAAARHDRILPTEAGEESWKISPVEATASYLAHLRDVWNARMGEETLDQQEVVLTVPASFDEVARTLTVEAARKAGYRQLTLLEEPLAAFYAWLQQHKGASLPDGATVLVCDVGGGTTDFSLITVDSTSDVRSYQRTAVGRHLLLGGDNMDAAVSHLIEKKLGTDNLDSVQWLRLCQEARHAKEQLLGGAIEQMVVTLQGVGSRVIGGSMSVEVTAKEVRNLLVDGFFGLYDYADVQQSTAPTGMRAMGLSYESEPSITKHLAQFLHSSGDISPDYVLFNGGTMAPESFRDRIITSLRQWFPATEVEELPARSLDLAVAYGASAYGKVRRGHGIRVRSAMAHALYLTLDVMGDEGAKSQAMAIVPRGSDEGYRYVVPHRLLVRPNTAAAFDLLQSHTRLNDAAGDLVSLGDEGLAPLARLTTMLRYGSKGSKEPIEVELEVVLTEVGTVELWLAATQTDHRWQLQFQVRKADGIRRQDITYDAEALAPAIALIGSTFDGSGQVAPGKLMEQLEQAVGASRAQWSPSILRGLWEAVIDAAPRRHVSPQHEGRWWNLVGFLLRPGYGVPLDEERMAQLWKVMLGDSRKRSVQGELQRWICLRRLAGGFKKGQQRQLGQELLKDLYDKRGKLNIGKDVYRFGEKIRALGAMEFLDAKAKRRLGEALVRSCCTAGPSDSKLWVVARMGSRHLVYGSVADLLPADLVERWVQQLAELDGGSMLAFTLMQLSRDTDLRSHQLPSATQEKVETRLAELPDGSAMVRALHSAQALEGEHQQLLLGDDLPMGLVLESHEVR